MGYCQYCGKQVPEGVTFCPSCGHNLNAASTPATQPAPIPSAAPSASAQPRPYAPAPARSSHMMRNIGVVILVIVLVVAVAAVIVVLSGSGSSGGGILPQQHNVNIVNGLITVSAGNYEYYQFAVPSGASGATLSGSFTASGGSGNDIIVLVMDSTDFVNWQNGHTASTYYNSGQVTTGSISANLPAGATYYLVYSNTFSIISTKNVQTTVDLNYTT